LTDGAGHQVTANLYISAPFLVSGLFEYKLTTPASLENSRLIAWSDTLVLGHLQRLVAVEVISIGAGSASDYLVRVLQNDGRLQAIQSGVAVAGYGMVTIIDMTPLLPAWLHLQIKDSFNNGVAGAMVILNDTNKVCILKVKLPTTLVGHFNLAYIIRRFYPATIRTALPFITGSTGNFTLTPGQTKPQSR